MKRNLYFTSVLLFLIVVFACLKFCWQGFMYFSLFCLIFLCIYWIITLVLYYIEDYYYCFEEDFLAYKAMMINTTDLTTEEFEQNKAIYIKSYKKSLRKDKIFDICKMLGLVMIVVVAILGVIRGF